MIDSSMLCHSRHSRHISTPKGFKGFLLTDIYIHNYIELIIPSNSWYHFISRLDKTKSNVYRMTKTH